MYVAEQEYSDDVYLMFNTSRKKVRKLNIGQIRRKTSYKIFSQIFSLDDRLIKKYLKGLRKISVKHKVHFSRLQIQITSLWYSSTTAGWSRSIQEISSWSMITIKSSRYLPRHQADQSELFWKSEAKKSCRLLSNDAPSATTPAYVLISLCSSSFSSFYGCSLAFRLGPVFIRWPSSLHKNHLFLIPS